MVRPAVDRCSRPGVLYVMEEGMSLSSLNPRKERGAIAAQACETCRTRKQKCDEVRPKCGTCVKGKHDCLYREPLPTKKDKTLVELLQLQKHMGAKVDIMYDMFTGRRPSPAIGPSLSSPSSATSTSHASPTDRAAKAVATEYPLSTTFPSRMDLSSQKTPTQSTYYHHTASHKILGWPAFQDLPYLHAANEGGARSAYHDQTGSAFLLNVYRDVPELSIAADNELGETPFYGMQASATRAAGGEAVGFAELTPSVMHDLATAYFDSYNLLYFFLDREEFISEMLLKTQTEGFHADGTSTIVLLVLALGTVAKQNAQEAGAADFAEDVGNGAAGIPGLSLFNEARKRIGYCIARCDLEGVQIFCLAALYYQAVFRYQDFWRLAAAAANACYTLVTCNEIDWTSRRGEMTMRVFWHCAMVETALYLELDLPVHPLVNVDREIGLPQFVMPSNEQDEEADRLSHWKQFYVSQIALRRICLAMNHGILEISSSTSNSPHGIVSPHHLKYLISQLTEWRRLLPAELQWNDSDTPLDTQGERLPHSFEHPALAGAQAPLDSIFVHPHLQVPVPNMTYAYDVQTAYLRTRYYQSRYLAHRPFIYKILSFPEEITHEDAEGAAICLVSTLKWPILYMPPVRYKRLIPYMCCWSQNFLSILLIYYASETSPLLKDVRARLCGPTFEFDLATTQDLMLGWFRDLRSEDAMAAWCVQYLQGLYEL